MTAANEKPITCLCCHSSNVLRHHGEFAAKDGERCAVCGCIWSPSKRRAQTAEGVDQKAIAESAWEAGYISAQQDERYPPAPPLPDHVFEMIMANARSEAVDEHIDKNWMHKRESCTCPPSCDYACKGECGCQTCREAYGDFLSAE